MSMVGKFVRLLVYPAVRPLESLKDASKQIREDLAKGREAREINQAKLAARAKEFAEQNTELTEEQILNPAMIEDPRKRFAALARLNQFTDAELEEQLVAVRRGRRFALGLAVVVTVLAVPNFLFVPAWIALFLMAAIGTVVAFSLFWAFKYGLFQYQLETQSLYRVRDYLSRPDFFSHLFS